MMKVKIYSDGGSRGNPGHAGFGVAIFDQSDKTISEISKYIGVKTNNEAEYTGLIAGLNWLKENYLDLDIVEAELNSDSELIVRQMQGIYKVKAGNLKDLNKQAREFVMAIKAKITFKSIRREFNGRADELANEAMDKKI